MTEQKTLATFDISSFNAEDESSYPSGQQVEAMSDRNLTDLLRKLKQALDANNSLNYSKPFEKLMEKISQSI